MKTSRSSFLTVNFYCLPHPIKGRKEMFQALYKKLHAKTVAAAISFKALGIKSEADMLNLFHRDLMEYGLGTEVRVVIENIPLAAAGSRTLFQLAVMKAVEEVFPRVRKVIGENYLEVSDSKTYYIMEDH
jgi:hypothetical protein